MNARYCDGCGYPREDCGCLPEYEVQAGETTTIERAPSALLAARFAAQRLSFDGRVGVRRLPIDPWSVHYDVEFEVSAAGNARRV